MSVASTPASARAASAPRQVVLLLAGLGLCPIAALLIGDDPAAPVARAETLISAERAFGIHVEPAVHAGRCDTTG